MPILAGVNAVDWTPVVSATTSQVLVSVPPSGSVIVSL